MNILTAMEEARQKQFMENKSKLKPCTQCGCDVFELREATNNNGQKCYPYFCANCDSRSPICEKKSIALKILEQK